MPRAGRAAPGAGRPRRRPGFHDQVLATRQRVPWRRSAGHAHQQEQPRPNARRAGALSAPANSTNKSLSEFSARSATTTQDAHQRKATSLKRSPSKSTSQAPENSTNACSRPASGCSATTTATRRPARTTSSQRSALGAIWARLASSKNRSTCARARRLEGYSYRQPPAPPISIAVTPRSVASMSASTGRVA